MFRSSWAHYELAGHEYADFRAAYEYLRSEGRVVAATSGGHQNLRWHEEVEACLFGH